MNPSILTRHQEIEAITLTEEEIKLAIWQAKHRKYNEEKNRDWWNDPDEKQKVKDDDSTWLVAALTFTMNTRRKERFP